MQTSLSDLPLILEAIEFSKYNWSETAREKQLLPNSDFIVWLVMAGRGGGKTRTGAETVRIWQRDNAIVNLIGATADDARDIMIEGESGILAICPKDERPEYVSSKRRIYKSTFCNIRFLWYTMISASNIRAFDPVVTENFAKLLSPSRGQVILPVITFSMVLIRTSRLTITSLTVGSVKTSSLLTATGELRNFLSFLPIFTYKL